MLLGKEERGNRSKKRKKKPGRINIKMKSKETKHEKIEKK